MNSYRICPCHILQILDNKISSWVIFVERALEITFQSNVLDFEVRVLKLVRDFVKYFMVRDGKTFINIK